MGKKILAVIIIILVLCSYAVTSSRNKYEQIDEKISDDVLIQEGLSECDHIFYLLVDMPDCWLYELSDDLTCICDYRNELQSGFYCGTWTNDDVILTCEYESGALWEIDPYNCEINYIGGGGVSLNGITYDLVNDELYGCSTSALYKIDPETGETEIIGNFNISTLMGGIACDYEGEIYAWDIKFSGNSLLYKVDKETGDATVVGSTGKTFCYHGLGHFCMKCDILYLYVLIYNPEYGEYLCAIDKDTGQCIWYNQLPVQPSALVIPWGVDYDPPVTTISFDPPEPDGCNGWYVSNVTATLNVTDEDGVNATYYRINGGEWNTYTTPFIISKEKENIPIEFYSVDNLGNAETIKSVTLDIDKTPPEIIIEYNKTKINNKEWLLEFNFIVTDETSGVDRIDIYLNDILQETITGPGPDYKWQFKYSGGLEITIGVGAWDNACNYGYNEIKIKLSKIKIMKLSIQMFLQFFESYLLIAHLLDILGAI